MARLPKRVPLTPPRVLVLGFAGLIFVGSLLLSLPVATEGVAA